MPPLDTHITPVDDLREHLESRECWCAPQIDRTGGVVLVIHQSADGRELIERHGIQ